MVRRLLVLLAGALLVACGSEAEPEPVPPVRSSTSEPAPAFDGRLEPAAAVLALVPQSADTVTVTDWDRARAQLGVPDLTGEDPMTDRIGFWNRAEKEAVLLTDGLLREDASTLELDYGFTQDDVDWEARFTGEDGPGFVLALRPDLALDGVRRAIRDGIGPLAGAELRAGGRLVVSGTAEEDVWAGEPGWRDLVTEPAAATYLHRGCIPVTDALGPDAGSEGLDRLLAQHPITTLDEVFGFAVAYGDHQATVRMEPDRSDLFERMRLGEVWPVKDFGRAYVHGAADPSSGRIGYTVSDPRSAAALALLRELPFGVCNEVTPIPEPTGL